MKRAVWSFAVSLAVLSAARAAEFKTGQAARAVLGQASFTARDASFTPVVVSIANGNLYAEDRNTRLLTFRLSQIPDRRTEIWRGSGTACWACGFAPVSAVSQALLPGLSGVAAYGKTLIAIDPQHRRVQVWRDTGSTNAGAGPDFYFSVTEPSAGAGPFALIQPVSVAYDGHRLFIGDAALHRVLIWNTLPSSPDRAPDTVLGQRDFTSMRDLGEIGPDTIDTPSGLVSDGANLFVADSGAHRILVFSVSDTSLPATAVVNAASLKSGPVAPGTLINIERENLADQSPDAPDEGTQPLPAKLAGVRVFFNGISLPLLAVTGSQIRAQVPYEFGEASAAAVYVRTEHNDGSVTITNPVAVPLAAASPGLFAFAGKEPRAAMALHGMADGEQKGNPVTSEDGTKSGEILTFWAAGLGQIATDSGMQPMAGTPYSGSDAPVLNRVQARVGSVAAEVLSANLTAGALGIYEVRILIPEGLSTETTTPVTISQGEMTSNTVTVPVRNTIQY